MSALQEQAVRMIRSLSDDNTVFLIEIMQRLMLQRNDTEEHGMQECPEDRMCMQAFSRLDAARTQIRQYLPEDFDPEKELEEARAERYGNIG